MLRAGSGVIVGPGAGARCHWEGGGRCHRLGSCWGSSVRRQGKAWPGRRLSSSSSVGIKEKVYFLVGGANILGLGAGRRRDFY